MESHNLGWQPYREPLSATLKRTIGIAAIAGAVAAIVQHRVESFAIVGVLALWFSFGGHWVELFFLNWLSPRLPRVAAPQMMARVLVWFLGGTLLTVGMELTAQQIAPRWSTLPAVWIGGLAFVGVELVVHFGARLRGRPNFYQGAF